MIVIGGGEAIVLLVVAGFVLLFYGSLVLTIVDAARRPDWQFTATGKSRTTWIVLPVLGLFCCGPLGLFLPIVYFASVRPQLERARPPAPWPPQWPSPTDAPPQRWEVGGSVGDDERPPPPPPPPPPLG